MYIYKISVFEGQNSAIFVKKEKENTFLLFNYISLLYQDTGEKIKMQTPKINMLLNLALYYKYHS